MKMKSGLSDGCSKCWGDVIACASKNCSAQCAMPMDAACQDCSNTNCNAAFMACSGGK
jgi:hypothetical protein